MMKRNSISLLSTVQLVDSKRNGEKEEERVKETYTKLEKEQGRKMVKR
jgi:hypothetical protein